MYTITKSCDLILMLLLLLDNFDSLYTAVGSIGVFDKNEMKIKFSSFCWRMWMISMASLRIEYRIIFVGLTVSQFPSFLVVRAVGSRLN